MIGTLGLNRGESCERTSLMSCMCFKTLRIFIIRTIAALIDKNIIVNYKFQIK